MTGKLRNPEANVTDLNDTALRVRAIESLLVEKGLVQPAALAAIVEKYETQIGPRNGASVVARAWTDPDYSARLLSDATAAIAELGFSGDAHWLHTIETMLTERGISPRTKSASACHSLPSRLHDARLSSRSR